jgi:CheY-like chemotaxis protein
VTTRRAVLVVDDDAPVRESIVQVLEDEGYPVRAAADGGEALRLLRTMDDVPGLIVLDLMMPGMDGFQFRVEQLADPRLSSIPVMLLSADANVQTKAASLDVEAIVKKPVTVEVLLEHVSRFCG